MNKRPEYMILIAVIAALVLGIIASAVSCAAITGAIQERVNGSTPGYNSIIEDIEGDGNVDPGEIIDEITGNNGDENSDENGDGQDGENREGTGSYTQEDVPASMAIEVPELTDDLQACLNSDLYMRLGSDVTVELSALTKEETATPELKGNRVLSKASGSVEVKTSDGKSGTVEYTSYYYAEDPTAQKITWYIYAYDLDSYDLFPSGFDKVAGDPMGARDRIDSGIPAPSSELGRDREFNSETA